MSTKVRVASTHDLTPGTSLEVTVGESIVAIFNVDGTLYAVDGLCAHQGGPLGSGELCGNIVTCPWHGWQYDVTTGNHCLNDHITQHTYAVEAEGEDVYIHLP